MKLAQEGQTLLITVLLFLAILITIPTIVYMHQVASTHGMQSVSSRKGRSIAEEGVAYAIHVLSSSGENAWGNVLLTGACPAEFTDPGPVPHVYQSPSGGSFEIQCSTGGPNLSSYQVQIRATALAMVKGTLQPVYALSAAVSKKTIGVSLPTGLIASVGVQLGQVPQIQAGAVLDPHLGPIEILDNNTWTIVDGGTNAQPDTMRFPRKFSVGGITGTSPLYPRSQPSPQNPVTDQKEYWAYSSLGFPAVIDTGQYQNLAGLSSPITTPACAAIQSHCIATPNGTGNLASVLNDTATFDAAGGYTAPAGSVIYINGNATFGRIAMDLKQGWGAVIVTGNLTVDLSGGTGGFPLNSGTSNDVRVPPTVGLEYPYLQPCPYWSADPRDPTNCHVAGACASSPSVLGPGGYCTSNYILGNTVGIDFRGFLYVQGNMTVTGGWWIMSGVLRVDKVLTVTPSNGFVVLMDDEISRHIYVTPFDLQVDSLREVTAQ